MKVTIELTDEELHALLETASGACGYWARTDERIEHVLKGPVTFSDAEEPDNVLGVLTLEKVRGAASVLAAHCAIGKVAPSLLGQLLEDPCCADGDVADALVQCALFGELVYG